MNVSAFSVELKVGTPIGDYRLTVVTGGVEPQESSWIALACIEDSMVYPGIPMPQTWRCVHEGTMVATNGRFFNTILGVLLLILGKLSLKNKKKPSVTKSKVRALVFRPMSCRP